MESSDRILLGSGTGNSLRYETPSVVTVKDLMKNEIGITIMLNDRDSLSKQCQELKNRVEELKDSRVPLSLQIANTLFNLVCTILVAIGVNMFTSNQSPGISYGLIILGVFLAISTNILIYIHPKLVNIGNFLKRIGK